MQVHRKPTIENRDPVLPPEIDWLMKVLSGHSDSCRITTGSPPTNSVMLESYTVFPDLTNPRLLIGAGSSQARAAALSRVNEHSGRLSGAARRAAAGLTRVGLDRVVSRSTVTIAVDPTEVVAPPGERAPITLAEYLAEALDEPGLHLAATIGPLRPNQKPVLQLSTADGELIAYAKVGWNPPTRELVDHEAEVLDRLSVQRLHEIMVPVVLHHGNWRDMSVLVTAPLNHSDEGRPDTELMAAALMEMATHGQPVESRLASSRYWSRLVRRTSRPGVSGRLSDVVSRIEQRFGDHRFRFGFGHGDWAPWNMRRLGRRLGVWDWERAADDVPLGLDLVHFHFQQGFHDGGASVTAGLDRARSRLAADLITTGIDQDDTDVLITLYLVELALRYEESALSDRPRIAAVSARLLDELDHLVPPSGSDTEDRRHSRSGGGAGSEDRKKRVFARRMLGGRGVPVPVRDAVKATVHRAGRATASMRTVPNTYIVGAQRCGTTSLFRYLTQHRSVKGPALEKGVHYFDTNYERGLDWYRSFFPTRRSVEASRRLNGSDMRILEAAPYYLFHPAVPDRIAEVSPEAKIIILVRDPVQRALSHHNHEVKRGFETEDFATALRLEDSRLEGELERMAADPGYVSFAHQHHSYVARGLYESQIRRYLEFFPAESVLIVRTVDLEHDPRATVSEVLSFLDIPIVGGIDFPRFNARSYPSMDPGIERDLRARFAESDAALADRLGLDRDALWVFEHPTG